MPIKIAMMKRVFYFGVESIIGFHISAPIECCSKCSLLILSIVPSILRYPNFDPSLGYVNQTAVNVHLNCVAVCCGNMFGGQTLFTDALGLCTTPNSIFAAVGNQSFLITNKSRVKLPEGLRQKKVFGFALSHEYMSSKRLLLLYSENEFSLFKYDITQLETFQLVYEGETKDWINAAIFLKEEKNCQFVLHMAHSALLLLQYDEDEKLEFGNCSILEFACCSDYSMLYHTTLYGNRYNELIVISGNGFGEILIWQPQDPVGSNSSTCTKMYPLRLRLKAHNGVIFSIDINFSAKLLVSTSDDRSLKFWQLESNSTKDCNWNESSISPMFSCFGHTARVMCAIIVEHGNEVFVISGGEDSNICIWSFTGEMLFKRRQQFGAPIWRLGFDSVSSTLYSTCAAGNILAYSLDNVLKRKQSEVTKLKPIDSPKEFVNRIKYLNDTTIVGLSNKNRMFYMKISKNIETETWKPVTDFPVYNCTVLAVRDGIVATCGFERLTLFKHNVDTDCLDKIYDGQMLNGIIKSFHFLDDGRYLISNDFGKCLILKGKEVEIEDTIQISHFRESWITAALLISSKYLVLSSRNGNVMLYARQESSTFQHKHTLKYLHGKMGSNILKFMKNDEKYAHILSAGHESTIKILSLSYDDQHLKILRRESVPLAWVEALPTLDILIGFNGDHLIAWSRQNDVILQMQCGGGHRCWDYQLSSEELNVIYFKKKDIFLHSELINRHSGILLKNNWHKKVCNIIELISPPNDAQPLYIVSAGDDNIIKISPFLSNHLDELHTHISTVRHLTIHQITGCHESYWLIFSVGGRAQLCINKFEPNGPIISELCSHTVRSSVDDQNNVLDARLMAINVLQLTENEFNLYLASGDGKIFLLRWHLDNPLNLKVLRIVDIKRCPLQLKYIHNINLLLVTTTNGIIYGYDNDLSLEKFQHQLHFAGINSFDALIEGENLHVLSGSDDESIKHSIIKLSDMSLKQIKELTRLHNAQINALILKSQKNDGNKIELVAYTCSMDKQIFMTNLKTYESSRIGFTCISDIKGMILYKNKFLYIYGCGLQILELKNNADQI